MNQQIFSMGLSVETVSVYLLCCGLADQGQKLSVKTLSAFWNSTSDALRLGLDRLQLCGILSRVMGESKGQEVYELEETDRWRQR